MGGRGASRVKSEFAFFPLTAWITLKEMLGAQKSVICFSVSAQKSLVNLSKKEKLD